MTPASFDADTALRCTIRPSPNHGDRKGRTVNAVILHYTGMPSTESALAHLSNPDSQVSCHYLVDEDGALVQLVPEARRAWHAGRSYWQGERDLNSVSIGIEIANRGHDGGLPEFPEPQMDVVIALCRDIAGRHRVPRERFLGHSDIAPDRKADPGERFPWAVLAGAGLGLWPDGRALWPPNHNTDELLTLALGACGYRVAAMQEALGRWGLDLAVSHTVDRSTLLGILAFQRHFRPSRVDGVADPQTLALIDAVASLSTGPG